MRINEEIEDEWYAQGCPRNSSGVPILYDQEEEGEGE